MLKTMLYDLTKSFMKTDCKTIVCCSADNHLRISSTTDDKQLYIYAESIADGWDCKEFAFRDWASVASIISSFYDVNEPDNCSMMLNKNDEDYPTLLRVKTGRMEMVHYLQSYSFISKQEDLLNTYKGKKFNIKPVEASDPNLLSGFTPDIMTKLSKLSSMTGEKYFKIKREDDKIYFCFGDETKTIDNGKILVQTDYNGTFTDNGLYFSVDYLGIAVNSLKNQDMLVKFDGKLITVSGKNDISNKVMVIVGKKEV